MPSQAVDIKTDSDCSIIPENVQPAQRSVFLAHLPKMEDLSTAPVKEEPVDEYELPPALECTEVKMEAVDVKDEMELPPPIECFASDRYKYEPNTSLVPPPEVMQDHSRYCTNESKIEPPEHQACFPFPLIRPVPGNKTCTKVLCYLCGEYVTHFYATPFNISLRRTFFENLILKEEEKEDIMELSMTWTLAYFCPKHVPARTGKVPEIVEKTEKRKQVRTYQENGIRRVVITRPKLRYCGLCRGPITGPALSSPTNAVHAVAFFDSFVQLSTVEKRNADRCLKTGRQALVCNRHLKLLGPSSPDCTSSFGIFRRMTIKEGAACFPPSSTPSIQPTMRNHPAVYSPLFRPMISFGVAVGSNKRKTRYQDIS